MCYFSTFAGQMQEGGNLFFHAIRQSSKAAAFIFPHLLCPGQNATGSVNTSQ
jgi:hypothetical protein